MRELRIQYSVYSTLYKIDVNICESYKLYCIVYKDVSDYEWLSPSLYTIKEMDHFYPYTACPQPIRMGNLILHDNKMVDKIPQNGNVIRQFYCRVTFF
jgi:hypothetical protein